MNTFMSKVRGKLLVLGGGLLLLVSMNVMAQVTYVYTDPQGTPLAEADVNGNITATFDYAPYGSIALGTAPNGPGYTGHVNDPDTGLVYMQARYYDPSVGRFISTDPVGPSEGNTFNFNRFAYAGNNPVDNIDPDGRSCTGSNITDSSGNCASTGESTTMAGNAHSAPAPKNSPSKNSAQQNSALDASKPAGGGGKTVEQIGDVVYQETRPMTDDGKAQETLTTARERIADVYLNGNHDMAPGTSNTKTDTEKAALQDSIQAVRNAVTYRAAGIDLTYGATKYNQSPNSHWEKPGGGGFCPNGCPIQSSSGPFANGNPTPPVQHYINIYW